MRLLFCCEFYHPSVGGVQEVMRQLAERMVQRGHQVTVATTRLPSRDFTQLNGVQIAEFSVTGNLANGMHGEIDNFRRFVKEFNADAMLIKAAQQWTFDALFPILEDIKGRKVFIPCGFSGLFKPEYKKYFTDLVPILALFDHLIFYAESYRDINYARSHGLEHYSIIPNGASELEFANNARTGALRQQLGIDNDTFLFSTVGSRTGVKGHFEVAQAFARLVPGDRKVALVLNGNTPVPSCQPNLQNNSAEVKVPRFLLPVYRTIKKARHRGMRHLFMKMIPIIRRILREKFDKTIRINYWIKLASEDPMKQVFYIDLPREGVVDLFRETDLFVFASNIEYSPLVLYEAAAAGTPFLTVPVGNSTEIARWTGAGIVCPAPTDAEGYTRVDPRELAVAMSRAMGDSALLKRLGETGRQRWREYFTWDKIATQCEYILAGLIVPGHKAALPSAEDEAQNPLKCT